MLDHAVCAAELSCPWRWSSFAWRLLSCPAGGPADYKLSLQGKAGEERQNALNACHSRGAWQLQKLCFANGGEQALLAEVRCSSCSGSMTKGCAAAGIYIKLGQHVAQLVSWKVQPTVMGAACCLCQDCICASFMPASMCRACRAAPL